MPVGRLACLAAVVALVLPAAASAHAYLVSSKPADRAVLATAPREVRLEFTEAVRPGPGIEAVRNGGGSVLAGPARSEGRQLVIPLRSGLEDGVYTVRWRALSDDGHTTGGVLAFGVGSGGAVTPSLSAGSTGAGAGQYAVRWLFFLGLLVAAGAAVFQIVVWRPTLEDELEGDERRRAERAERRTGSLLAAAGFAVALLGAGLLLSLSNAGWDTRFGRVLEIGLGIGAVGLVASLATLRVPSIRPLALTAALAMLPLPTLAGHALDQGHNVLDVVIDVAHVTAAAVWIGGLAAFALALWTGDGRLRLPLARNFSALALAAVILLAGTGLGRALEELASFSQLWTTGYGRALLVKTALLAVLIVLAARNQLFFLSGPLQSLRRGVTAEAVVLVGLVVAVAVLTALPPGRTAAASRLRPVPSGPSAPSLPPPGAVVLAQEAGRLALALSARPAPSAGLRLTATVLSPGNTGVDGLALTFRVNGTRGAKLEPGVPCGSGCYSATTQSVGDPRAVTVDFAGETAATLRFGLPRTWPAPAATALVDRATAKFRGLRSVRYRERLASSPQTKISTLWTQVAPDRLQYSIRGGADGILIGGTRWDRTTPTGQWVKSATQPIAAPTPIWPRRPANAHLLAKTKRGAVVSLLDRSVPAWFTIRFDRRLRPRSLEMTAAGHFMHHDYLSFNGPLVIKAPGVSR
jgi:copper transport protein